VLSAEYLPGTTRTSIRNIEGRNRVLALKAYRDEFAPNISQKQQSFPRLLYYFFVLSKPLNSNCLEIRAKDHETEGVSTNF
jgi:hypothetical protein